MQLAGVANDTFLLTTQLYATTLTPGVSDNQQELDKMTHTLDNLTATLTQVNGTLTTVDTDLTSVQTKLDGMYLASTQARDKMLQTVDTMQGHAESAAVVQRQAEDVFQSAESYRVSSV